MKRQLLGCSLFLLAAACAGEKTNPTTSEPSLSSTNAGQRYIVVFKDEVVGAQATSDQLLATVGAKADFVYSASIKGFAARMSALSADQLRKDPRVKYIELDKPVHIAITQTPTPSWGLDRIDQNNLPLNNSYTYANEGAGVHFYGIDTGILGTHTEFTGRMSNGVDEIGGGTTDCNGHGSHTASTVGGTKYGVAKKVTIHPVRVLDCGGSGTFAQVIAGIDWVTANHQSPAVANMSLGGGFDQATNDAVTASIASGVVYSISSGNSSANACSFSPASTPNAITVNASDITDVRASFSNFGTCTDIFGPGVNITGAWIGAPANNATNTISGTSMAAPHVAGAAALYLSANPTATPAQVATALINNATNNKITNPGTGSPNKLIYMGFIGGGGPGNVPPTAAFTYSCTAARVCTFDGTGSTDSDGTVVGYAWHVNNANGKTVGSTATFTRTFPKGRTFNMVLVVTDNQGATNAVTHQVIVP